MTSTLTTVISSHRAATRIALALAILATLTSCVHLGGAQEIPPNLDTYEGLAAAIADGADILIYDVRTPEETESGVIPGAVNIPHTEIAEALPRNLRRQVIVVYCQSGGRSRAAYDALVDKRFRHVYDFGAIGNWTGPLETVEDCGCPG